MSISSLGVYPSNTLGGVASAPADQQAKDALAQASYQSKISDYGQIQNSLSVLQSSVQGGQALPADAPSRAQAAHASQENRLFQGGPNEAPASPASARIAQAVQSFVDAYNSIGNQSSVALNAVSSATLSGIGITADSNGKLSFDAQAFQNALSANPGNVAQVFSAIASSTQASASGIPSGQAGKSVQQTEFASQSSNIFTNPAPAQRVESRTAPSVASSPSSSLAAQYSIVSQLG